MTTDSKQETTSWTAGIVAGNHLANARSHIDINFESKEVEKTFSSVVNSRRATRGRLVIYEVKSDGYFHGKILLT